MLQTVLIDDEYYCLQQLKALCKDINEIEIAGSFQFADEAFDFINSNKVDLVLTDISMPGLDGLQAAQLLRDTYPNIGVIFVTGVEEHALKAFNLDAIAYLLKPCSTSALKKAIDKAIRLSPPIQKKVFVQTFGSFCVYNNDSPIKFANSKAKELLALAVDKRGGSVSMEYATGLLWEDRPYDNGVKQLYRKAISYLHSVMRENNFDFFVSERGSCHIIPSRILCDAYRLLDNDQGYKAKFSGMYLPEYTWGEETAAYLYNLTNKVNKI